MSGTDEDQQDKPFEASPRKLEDARKKGEIVRSQDVVNLAVLVVMVFAIGRLFSTTMMDMVHDVAVFVARSINGRITLAGPDVFGVIMRWLLPLFLFLFATPFVIVVAGLVMTRQMLFTADKAKPRLDRLSLVANAKKKFGAAGLFEFFKNFLKFTVLAALMAVFASNGFDLFQISVLQGDHAALASIYRVAFLWLWCMVGIYLVFAGVDLLWQIRDHARRNRMSHKELKDEHKSEEGDETIRQQRRAKAEEIATNRMLLDVPKSTVVITNPTHYAVALQWGGEADTVPKCVARGTDETARRIREIAIQSGVPLYRDPPTARALYANVKLGMPIETTHYRAVAAAVGYARRIERMARRDRT